MEEIIKNCPICGCDLRSYDKVPDFSAFVYDCPKCSKFKLTDDAWDDLKTEGFKNPDFRNWLSAEIVKQNKMDPDEIPLIDSNELVNKLLFWREIRSSED